MTQVVCPAVIVATAFVIVRHGAACVPGLLSLPLVETYNASLGHPDTGGGGGGDATGGGGEATGGGGDAAGGGGDATGGGGDATGGRGVPVNTVIAALVASSVSESLANSRASYVPAGVMVGIR